MCTGRVASECTVRIGSNFPAPVAAFRFSRSSAGSNAALAQELLLIRHDWLGGLLVTS
jgi:hypothetical protein